MRRCSRGRSFGLVGAVAVIGVACSGETPVGADADSGRVPGAPIALAVAPTYSTGFSPTTSRSGIGPIALGTYPEPTLVEIRATGTIDRYYGFVWYYYSLQGQFDRTIDAGGDYGTQYVHIAFDSPAMGWFKDTQGLPLQEEWSKVVVVQGSGRAEWVRPGTGGQCDTPGTPDCFSYTGSFDVSATPFPAELVLKASKQAVTPGQSVTFTASVVPDSIENIGVPFKVAEWRWLPDAGGGGTVLTQCANQKTCIFAPSVSGTMRATGFANGADAIATVFVSVVPCLVGDSLLNDSRLRKLLSDILAGSNPDESPWNRIERTGARLLMPDGSFDDVLFPPSEGSGPCHVQFPAAGSYPGVVVIGAHSHPFSPGDPSDPLPYDPSVSPPTNCKILEDRPPPPPGKVYTAAPKPSDADAGAYGGVRHYIVDKRNVWRIPGLGEPDQEVKRIPRQGSGTCDPLAL